MKIAVFGSIVNSTEKTMQLAERIGEEIAKNSHVAWTVFSEIWPKLVEKHIVVAHEKLEMPNSSN